MFSAPLLPGRGWTLPEPSARSSLLASRLPRHSHSPSHGPEPVRTFGCRLCRAPRKDAPTAPREPSSCWGRVENHNLPLHGAASHTETVPAISPQPPGPETPPGDTREASAPALLGSSSLLGQGVGVGMDAVVMLWLLEPPSGLYPELLPAGHPLEKQPRVLLERDRLPVRSLKGFPASSKSSPSSLVEHEAGASVPVPRAATSFCTRRGWEAVGAAPLASCPGQSEGWRGCSAQGRTRGTS